jgi:hypothetical protein
MRANTIIVVPAFLFVLAGCKNGPFSPAAPACAGVAARAGVMAAKAASVCWEVECPSLRPVPGGRVLVVENSWILDPANGEFTKLPFKADDLAFSPDGEMMALRKGWDIMIGPLAGPLREKKVRIPMFIPIPQEEGVSEDDPDAIELLAPLMAWVSRVEILVALQQDSGREDFSSGCRVYDVKESEWSEPAGGCPQGGMFDLWFIDPGPGGLLAIYSSGEGHPDVTVAKYTPAEGQKVSGVPVFDLYPFGPLDVFFSGDAGKIFFITSCTLGESKRPCMGPDGEGRDSTYPLRLYEWRSDTKALMLIRQDVPFGGVLLSGGEVLAWPLPGKVCIGDPSDGKKTRCHAVPAEEADGGAGR